jgi:O-antigen ligase
MRTKYIWKSAEVILLILILLLANLRSFYIFNIYPDTSYIQGQAWRVALIWVCVIACLIILMRKQNLFRNFIYNLSSQKFLIAFLIFSLLSITWSISVSITLHRSLIFLFVSLTGIYLATRYSLSELIRVLYWFGTFLMAINYLVAIFFPLFGTVQNVPSLGAWRGIFWNKNHLGNLMPIFSGIYLISFFLKGSKLTKFERFAALPLYILSLLLVYLSDSAAGYIIEIILLGSLILAILWLRFASRLSTTHYTIILAVIIIGIAIISLNLDFFFGLLNRSTSLTGRIPMWNYLFDTYFLDRPWLGHGFGTIWAIEEIRVEIQEAVGWWYPVMIGDNGFIDILLNTGSIGLIIFMAFYLSLWIRSIKSFISERSIESLIIPLFLIYTLFANLSFSLFMETEVFIWLLLVVFSGHVLDRGERQITS